MVRYTIYCFLLVVSLFTGCAPGIVDPPPTPAGTAGEYFWPSNLTGANYERLDASNQKYPYTILFRDGSSGRVVADAGGSTSASELTYRATDEGIVLENIGKNSILPLPEGFRLVSDDFVDSTINIPREIDRVYVTGVSSLLSIDARGMMYYSLDGGLTWMTSGWTGGVVSTFASRVNGNVTTVYAGTTSGSIYRTENSGKSWQAIVKPLQSKVTAIAVDDTVLYFALGEKVFRAGLSGADTLRISNNQLKGNVDHLAIVNRQLQPDTTWLIAGTEQNGFFRTPLSEDDSSFYWIASSVTPHIDKALGLVSVNEKNLFALGESSGEVFFIASSNQGESWVTASTDPISKASKLAYDGKGKLLVSGNYQNIVGIYMVTGAAAKMLRVSTLDATHVNDVSGYNATFAAATDKGGFVTLTSGETWTNLTASALTDSSSIRVPAPGSLLVLKEGEHALDTGSTWIAGNCEGVVLGSLHTLNMKATVLPHLTKLDLTSYGSLEFEDVIPVRYAPTPINGVNLDISLMIYYARNKGPVWIRQLSGKTPVVEIYRLAD